MGTTESTIGAAAAGSFGLGGLAGEPRAGGRAKIKTVGVTRASLPALKPKAKAEGAPVNGRVQAFLFWLQTPSLGSELIYFRGELSRSAVEDTELAELASAIRAESNAGYVECSPCGHERGFTQGTGRLAIVMRRGEGNEQVHVVRRLAQPAES